MATLKRTRRVGGQQGFTLVEILIVVIILGILAAIVIPQFTNASTDARKSNMASQLQTLKSQVALYKLQHNDALPSSTSATFWSQLTMATDVGGSTSPAAGVQTYGPYLPQQSVNPLTGVSTIAAVGSPSATVGWTYSSTGGTLHGVVKDSAGTYHESDDGYHDISGTLLN